MGYGLNFYWKVNTERFMRKGIFFNGDFPKERMYKIGDALYRPSPVLKALFNSWDTEKQGSHPFCDVWGKDWCECTFSLNDKYARWGYNTNHHIPECCKENDNWKWELGLGREIEMDLIKFMKENEDIIWTKFGKDTWNGKIYTMKFVMGEMKMLMEACMDFECKFFTYT